MRRIWRRILTASVLLTLSLQGEPSRSAAQTPAAQLGRPVVARPGAAPSVVLGRPVVAPPVDPELRQTSARVVRGQTSEEPPTQLHPPRQVNPPAEGVGTAFMPYAASGSFPIDASSLYPGGSPDDAFANGDGTTSEFNSRLYVGAEYLLWWIRGSRFPTLVTTSSFSTQTTPPPGTLGQAGTFPVLGGASVGRMEQSGLRLRGGYWFDDSHAFGLEGVGFFLGERSMRAAVDSNGLPTVSLPFQVNGVQSALPLTLTPAGGFRSAAVRASMGTEVWGGEINLRRNLVWGHAGHLDLIGGFRTLGLDDDFRFLTTAGSAMAMDWLSTQNRFYGGQIGLVGEVRRGVFFSEWTAKVALGGVRQEITSSGGSNTGAGGVLFGAPRRLEENRFAVLPEVGVNAGVQLTNHVRIFAGYNFLFLSSAARPGEQINTDIAASPATTIKSTNFWAHGVNFGLELKW